MKKALVLGASGSMGYAIVNELCGRGIHVVAFARNKERLGALFSGNKHVEVVAGDVFVKEDIMNAAKDVDIIFHVVNIPYSDWEKQQEKLLINILEVSKHYGIKLGIVDNIYAYGRQGEGLVKEEAKKDHTQRKGRFVYNLKRWQNKLMYECLLLISQTFMVQMQKAHLFIIH